ncbi:class I mannose-6-phosphate isomerase [Lacticaseibacillus absianus]|uniref:class I mannose-6-phosphate isomerase n=1 Tax=Lacticaseibacillus absianus TaxID=2729623 RepID=UPI0015C787CC|nr:class I mannose-6-phosphate isomerase [Lacticaseibacillus absianus]
MTYELHPVIAVKQETATVGDDMWPLLAHQLGPDQILCLECYPGVDLARLRQQVEDQLHPALLIDAAECTLAPAVVSAALAPTLTDDRVFGLMTHAKMADYFDQAAIAAARQAIAAAEGLVVVYGVGASLVAPRWDCLVYVNITRWEIQKRFRKGLNNWLAAAPEPDQLKKVKRGYFFEWRIADRQKSALQAQIDYQIDATTNERWVMVAQATCERLKTAAVTRPFRLVPYFDQSPWGGQWMKTHFGLDPQTPNYGWAFDGVPEENSVLFELANARFELPAIDLVHERPLALLGERVYARFGAEFPIRFDYLDTMGGGNLSLQVHPKVGYIQSEFGMAYTQNESYYIMAAGPDASIYLGVKDGVDKAALFEALTQAQADPQAGFDDTQFVNRFPVKAHDHYSIPAGTIHCGGRDAVVLEISATPYLFTFKLWDWGRLGLDGRPRPIHLAHGRQNVDTRFNTSYAQAHLFSPETALPTTQAEHVERTGLSDLEFIETRRHTFAEQITLPHTGTVNMLNLVEGTAITLQAVDQAFPPVTIHYGETFIIPAACGDVRVINAGSAPAKVLQAFVR